jgi:hypothetical protein
MQPRQFILKRLTRDLVGPFKTDEILEARPSDVYLTGILFPQRTPLGADEDDDAGSEGSGKDDGSSNEAVASSNVMRPSTAGLSFAITADADWAAINIRIRCGTYQASDAGAGEPAKWSRTAHIVWLKDLVLEKGKSEAIDLTTKGLKGLVLHTRTAELNGNLLVTVVIANHNELAADTGRQAMEQQSFFQADVRVEACEGFDLVPRPDGRPSTDEEEKSAQLIYRHAEELAVGHLCSANWSQTGNKTTSVRTTWLPTAVVSATSPGGADSFGNIVTPDGGSPFSADWLVTAELPALKEGLMAVAQAYQNWITKTAERVRDLPVDLQPKAHEHLASCADALARINRGIATLTSDTNALLAFRLANRAMLLQRQWSGGGDLRWRPFQLAFFLLTFSSSADPSDPDRGTMDLLWFPTGGGKTEAYLLLSAFVLFSRRLGSGQGGGVAILMRYTLRLLTIQQYERAAAVICACELIRLGLDVAAPEIPPTLLAATPISLGLWVGGDSTPNTVVDASKALLNGGKSSPRQLESCPCCRRRLEWKTAPSRDRIWATCVNGTCLISQLGPNLPVWTVDEDVYRELPSLLIGTGDKFAQIVRTPSTRKLFGIDTDFAPPDLIIQDELHLISGPLGTISALYEIAIDELCSRDGRQPKLIGSTATIRKAESQIRALFDRNTFQFPPPGIDHDDSGFAMAANPKDLPGRLYVGVTTAGRSAKFALQAVSASLLQASSSTRLTDAERDPYWSLVAYFNSLRELGGALVLMQDDVLKTADNFAERQNEQCRQSFTVTELTSRVDSSSIPEVLAQLAKPAGDPDAIDVVLASNMISVGVDVPRLGLMLVNGQPKGIAEYIQATSRVGRGAVPGLVVSLLNANKARDRSHYETFRTWHQTLYRNVEATSVTPFAARARDRALHAPFVAIARHLVDGLQNEPVDISGHEAEIGNLIDRIVSRARRIDPEEAEAVEKFLEQRLEDWVRRGPLQSYWNDNKLDDSLLMSAEKAAEREAGGFRKHSAWPTPNSLRSVEASVDFILRSKMDEPT